jgi:cell division septal protein FtsQ
MTEKRELSRAEQVRARRRHSITQTLAQNTQRTDKPAMHVITSRAGTSYVQPRRTGNDSRRRFNIALGLPHISLHRPALSLPRLRERWRPASLLLAMLFGALIYLTWTLPYFHVGAATVFGNSRLTQQEIDAVLGVSGQSIFLMQPDDLETRLRLNYPELASAQINVYLPNHVHVSVSERQPLILWQQGDGFTWIDVTGVAFRPRGQVNGLIPVISLATPPAGDAALDDPLSPPQFIQRELVDAIVVLASSVPAGSTLTYHGADGLGWKDSRGWDIFFGTSASDMALKLRVYQSLVDSLAMRGQVPEYINVAYPDAPYYRMSTFTGFNSTNESE